MAKIINLTEAAIWALAPASLTIDDYYIPTDNLNIVLIVNLNRRIEDSEQTEEQLDGNFDNMIDSLGIVRKGIKIIPNADLTFGISVGKLYDQVIPDGVKVFDIPAQAVVTFKYFDSDLLGVGVAVTSIETDTFFLDGVSTPVGGGNNTTFQRVYINTAGEIRVTRGIAVYNTPNLATDRYTHEERHEITGFIFIGGMLVQDRATNLASSRMRPIYGTKLGEF